MKNTIVTFNKFKKENKKLTMLTAYDYISAKLFDECNINGLLIGDSLGMVVKGDEDTLGVTVSDMPFMSYHVSIEQAVMNAGRIIKEGGAHAVKLEGGAHVKDAIKAIVQAQIPVMGHLGLTPQSVNCFGGFKVQGKSEEEAKRLIEEAKQIEETGAFAVVLEGIPSQIAKIITDNLNIPTIGIGAGKDCDGQILVYQDMLGMFEDFVPKFVKQYGKIGSSIKESVKEYIKEVENGSFPDKQHSYSMDDEVLKRLY